MNRAERRLATAINRRQLRFLGEAVQNRDAARAEIERIESMVAEDVAAGRSTAWAERGLPHYKGKLAEAEVAIEAAREEVAMREAAVEASKLAIIIDTHIAEIGLDAIPY